MPPSSTSWKLLVLGALVLSSCPREALAEEKGPVVAEGTPTPKSVGFPNRGSLRGGERLETSETIQSAREHRWGLPVLIGLVERAAAYVAREHPGSVLVVGDLSREGGGEIKGHDSHESGRDVDLGFYLLRDGEPFVTSQDLAIDKDGSAKSSRAVSFDDARNWSLIEALVGDREARVMQIFVADHLRIRLMREARRAGASADVLDRARAVLVQPRAGQKHDDHFHVRIRCPKGQRDCVDFPARRFAKVTTSAPAAKKKVPKKPTRRGAKPAKRQPAAGRRT